MGYHGPLYGVGQVLGIPVGLGSEALIAKGIVLDQVLARVSTREKDAFSPGSNHRKCKGGDRCLLISGRMRNTTTEDIGVGFCVNGHYSNDDQVAWTLTSDRLPGHAHLTVPAELSKDFEIVVSCENDMRCLVLNASTDSESISLQPALGAVLAEGVILEQAFIRGATLKQAALNVETWRHHLRGDWCLQMSGRVRNTMGEVLDKDVYVWIDG